MFARRVILEYRQITRALHSSPNSTFTTRSNAPLSRHAFSTFQRSRPNAREPWRNIWQRAKEQQQKRAYRQPLNYARFQQTRGLFRRWAARPTFYYEISGIGGFIGGVYIYNLEPVPVSGRKRFNIIGPDFEKQQGQAMFQQTMQQFGPQLMPSYSKEHKMVARVLQRLLPHSGLEEEEWEVHVINDDMKNAFVIPGGKVFVFRGILNICQGEDGLAAVLGHEIAHNVAHHAAERMSQGVILQAVALLAATLVGVDFGITRMINSLAFELPGSRAQEEEADYIGLLMMAESCYDPSAAMGLWQRMEENEKRSGQSVPQFMSTHPSNHNRLEKIRGWLPQAEAKLEEGGCSTTALYARDFANTTGMSRW